MKWKSNSIILTKETFIVNIKSSEAFIKKNLIKLIRYEVRKNNPIA